MSKFTCPVCGREHDELPVYAFEGPVMWLAATPEERERDFRKGPDLCRWLNEHFLIRTRLRIPITDSPGDFLEAGVWVKISKENYDRYRVMYLEPDAGRLGVFYGWLANGMPGYEDVINLKVAVVPQNDRMRPFLKVIENEDHPLQRDQEEGIILDQAMRWLHDRGGF